MTLELSSTGGSGGGPHPSAVRVWNNGRAFTDSDWQRVRKIAAGNPDEASVGLFKKKGEVREPRAFVPGEYGPSQPAAAAKAGKSKGGLRVSIKIRNDCSAACSIRS